MNRIKFLIEGLKDMKTVGTVARTSRYAGRQMLRRIDFQHADCIVEFGAGDGVITKLILERMKPTTKLLSFEVNPTFCELLSEINDPRLTIINDSAELVDKYLQQHGFAKADHVVSAIPFTTLPEAVAAVIVEQAKYVLKVNGYFVQIHYSLVRRRLYKKVFGNVDVELTPINIPPAFIMTSRKE